MVRSGRGFKNLLECYCNCAAVYMLYAKNSAAPLAKNARTLSTVDTVSAFAGELSTPIVVIAWLIAGAGTFESGWVCCIFTVAFGSVDALFDASLGRLMRAVSFFGDAGRTGCEAIPDWPGAGGAGGRMPDGGGGMAAEPAGAAGFKGIVGLPVSGGGLGGVMLLSGLVIGAPPGFGGGGAPESGRVATPDGAAGADGGATGERGAAGGVTDSGIGIFEVSFFGTWPTAAGADVPGTLIRTVSLFIEGCSVFGGSVIRMVSFLVESSSCMFGWSAMLVRGGEIGISASHSGVNGVFGEIPVREGSCTPRSRDLPTSLLCVRRGGRRDYSPFNSLILMHIEPLESRIAPATFTVTTNAVSGAGSLLDAVAQAEAAGGLDTITFNLPANELVIQGVRININSPMIFDGRSQPGYTDTPLVQLNGVGVFDPAFQINSGAAGSSVLGMDARFYLFSGVDVRADDVTIAGCTFHSNGGGIDAVSVDNLTIGGAGASGKNVITGNHNAGISVTDSSNIVIQNTNIGVSRSGLVAGGNSGGSGNGGIFMNFVEDVTIGGAGGPNVISGNTGAGLTIYNSTGVARVQNTIIGLYANGTFNAASANTGGGILAAVNAALYVGNFESTNPLPANYIANSGGVGIDVDTTGSPFESAHITGAFIGITPGGAPAPNAGGGILAKGLPIVISDNSIWSPSISPIRTSAASAVVINNNSFTTSVLPIDVFGNGPTGNDSNEQDAVQNFPVLSGAYADGNGSYIVNGTLQSTPNTSVHLTIYGVDSRDIIGDGIDNDGDSFIDEPPSYIAVSELIVTTDSTGFAIFRQTTDSLANYSGVAANASREVPSAAAVASELSAFASVGPAIVFTDTTTITQAEGNTGVAFATFNVSLTATATGAVSVALAPSTSSTAIGGTDFSFSPAILNFSPGISSIQVTVAITGDTLVEPAESINFILANVSGNAQLIGSTKTVIIANDDTSLLVATDGKSATWRDVDGDFVTLKSTKAILDLADFSFVAKGLNGGEELQLLNLSDDGIAAKGAGLAFTAKFDKLNNRGDGSVHIGYLNATGVDLGAVAIPGDLGRITAGDATDTDGGLKSLTVGSIGVLGTSTQGGGSLFSAITGKVGTLTVKGDIIGASLGSYGAMLNANGGFSTITIGGSLITTAAQPGSVLSTSGDIGAIKIGGSVVRNGGNAQNILATGKLGAISIGGELRGSSNAAPAVIQSGKTIGKVSVASMSFAEIYADGNANPANAAAAIAIAGVSVRGSVTDSIILAGVHRGLSGGNVDVQIGALSVGGDWVRSSAAAGINAGNTGVYGTVDDALATPFGTNNAAIVSKIASVTVKGHIFGSSDSAESWGFVAQSIGKFTRDKTAYTLRPATTPLDVFSVSLQGNVTVREVV